MNCVSCVVTFFIFKN